MQAAAQFFRWCEQYRLALTANRFARLAHLHAEQFGYDRPVGEAVYTIDDFPDDDLLWRIEWIGGVGYNSSVPTDPLIDICLAQLLGGGNDPLSARSRSSQTKRTVRIGVGLLPYIAIASVWRRRQPVLTNLCLYRSTLAVAIREDIDLRQRASMRVKPEHDR